MSLMAVASTMFWMADFLMALFLGKNQLQLVQKIGCTLLHDHFSLVSWSSWEREPKTALLCFLFVYLVSNFLGLIYKVCLPEVCSHWCICLGVWGFLSLSLWFLCVCVCFGSFLVCFFFVKSGFPHLMFSQRWRDSWSLLGTYTALHLWRSFQTSKDVINVHHDCLTLWISLLIFGKSACLLLAPIRIAT